MIFYFRNYRVSFLSHSDKSLWHKCCHGLFCLLQRRKRVYPTGFFDTIIFNVVQTFGIFTTILTIKAGIIFITFRFKKCRRFVEIYGIFLFQAHILVHIFSGEHGKILSSQSAGISDLLDFDSAPWKYAPKKYLFLC